MVYLKLSMHPKDPYLALSKYLVAKWTSSGHVLS